MTHNAETIGQLSCNPSVGGIGKGHLVKELDAMGGAMAAVTDAAGIQFRILNASKGPAVRSTRAQIDRQLYRMHMRKRIEGQENLWLFQQAATDLIVENGRVVGVVTQIGVKFRARAVVLCAGTFLNGLVHVGLEHYPAGRVGDPPAIRLAQRLADLGMPRGRLKTGTPVRVLGRTIDFAELREQPSAEGGGFAFGESDRDLPFFGDLSLRRRSCLYTLSLAVSDRFGAFHIIVSKKRCHLRTFSAINRDKASELCYDLIRSLRFARIKEENPWYITRRTCSSWGKR